MHLSRHCQAQELETRAQPVFTAVSSDTALDYRYLTMRSTKPKKTQDQSPEFASPAPARQQIVHETQNLAERDAEQKKKIKANTDQKLGARESKIKLGDTVLVKQPKTNKLRTPFSPVPLVNEEKKGSMVTASD